MSLGEKIKAFVVHVSFLEPKITINLVRKAQMALLLAKKVIVPAKYSDFADLFLEESANMLSEQTGVNKHATKLEEGKKSPYKPIYSLELVELKTFKIYIKTNLANSFIKAWNSPASALILFIYKPNNSFAGVLITKGSITSQSKIAIRCHWSVSH